MVWHAPQSASVVLTPSLACTVLYWEVSVSGTETSLSPTDCHVKSTPSFSAVRRGLMLVSVCTEDAVSACLHKQNPHVMLVAGGVIKGVGPIGGASLSH